MATRRNSSGDDFTKRAPATNPDDREKQVVSLAVDLAERQIQDGTVSSQVLVHYLRLATMREKLEREKLTQENEMLRAKQEQMASGARSEEMYAQALNAMRAYSGQDVPIEEDEY